MAAEWPSVYPYVLMRECPTQSDTRQQLPWEATTIRVSLDDLLRANQFFAKPARGLFTHPRPRFWRSSKTIAKAPVGGTDRKAEFRAVVSSRTFGQSACRRLCRPLFGRGAVSACQHGL